MRFRALQALHAVIETGTVTAAAKTLGVSQPAVSNLLAQLEAQTRLTLFIKSGGGSARHLKPRRCIRRSTPWCAASTMWPRR